MKKILFFIFIFLSAIVQAQTGTGWGNIYYKLNHADSVNFAKGFKISGLTVTTTGAQLNYINTLSSNAQTQITGKISKGIVDSVNTVGTDAKFYNSSGDTLPPYVPVANRMNFADALFAQNKEFNPKNYGAVGDGVTNDTEAMQDCIDAAKNRTVRISDGVYLVDSLNVFYGTRIVGAGVNGWTNIYEGTTIKSTSPYPIFHIEHLPGFAYSYNAPKIENLKIMGNNIADDGVNSQIGILVETEAYANFTTERVEVVSTGGHGIQLGTADNHVSKVWINNTRIGSSSKSGIYGRAQDSHQVNGIKITNCQIGSNAYHGIDLIGLNVNIRDNIIASNDSCGINFYPYDKTSGSYTSYNVTVKENYFEGDNIYIAYYYKAVTPAGYAVYTLTIDDNYFYVNQTDIDNGTAIITLAKGIGSTTIGTGLNNVKIGKGNFYSGNATYYIDGGGSTVTASTSIIEIPFGYSPTKFINIGRYSWAQRWGQNSYMYGFGATASGFAVTDIYPKVRLTSLASAIDITTNPQIADGYDGETIQVMGYSATNVLKLEDGNGLSLAGGATCLLGAYDWIILTYSATYDLWTEVTRSEPNSPVYVIKKSIGTPGDAEDFNFATVANSNEQVLTLTNVLPANCRVTAIEIKCSETLAGSGTHEIVFQFGTSSSGEEFIAATGAGTMDDANEIQGIIDATKPAAVQMTAAARSLYLTGDIDANWDTITAGKWTVYITCMNYNGR